MAEYLEREKLLEILRYRGTQYAPKPFEGGFVSGWHEAIDEIESDVEDIPAADVRPERHGRWEAAGNIVVECSACGDVYSAIMIPRYFCPNCGAKMDEEDGASNAVE